MGSCVLRFILSMGTNQSFQIASSNTSQGALFCMGKKYIYPKELVFGC